MNISICLEAGEPCTINTVVFTNSYLPVQECSFTDNSNDFSVTQYLSAKHLDIAQNLSDIMISKLLERLDVAEYLQDTQCNRDSLIYTPATATGWKKGQYNYVKS